MYVKDIYSDKYKYLEDTSSYPYKDAVSVIVEDNLNEIGESIGLDYINMNNKKMAHMFFFFHFSRMFDFEYPIF